VKLLQIALGDDSEGTWENLRRDLCQRFAALQASPVTRWAPQQRV